jgi:hypothetical protein
MLLIAKNASHHMLLIQKEFAFCVKFLVVLYVVVKMFVKNAVINIVCLLLIKNVFSVIYIIAQYVLVLTFAQLVYLDFLSPLKEDALDAIELYDICKNA